MLTTLATILVIQYLLVLQALLRNNQIRYYRSKREVLVSLIPFWLVFTIALTIIGKILEAYNDLRKI